MMSLKLDDQGQRVQLALLDGIADRTVKQIQRTGACARRAR